MKTVKKKSIREEVWLRTCGERFSHPCITRWCSNRITVFDFHVAHNIPSSRGGMNTFENLKPMCARCNYAMGNRYTIDEWQNLMSVSNSDPHHPATVFPSDSTLHEPCEFDELHESQELPLDALSGGPNPVSDASFFDESDISTSPTHTDDWRSKTPSIAQTIVRSKMVVFLSSSSQCCYKEDIMAVLYMQIYAHQTKSPKCMEQMMGCVLSKHFSRVWELDLGH